ncbi:hypothetical protein RFI_22314 [Reticulomyxa filosa]|uniref:Uncharacterized protein n=1 Tax=Reticulomyxa filosa TaxID=46433 RepID=X6MPN1_RETFI|nr:hypothetical protein RFI_22314 [Reticulomyxa filosa]|eukprot:ETO15050.1 hypothetical protein RFI_22314 [Reticulomyxa filosa]
MPILLKKPFLFMFGSPITIIKVQNFNFFRRHNNWVKSVKYGSNTILSGSSDSSIRLWDIRSGGQIQIFNGHTYNVETVEYSPFIINNIVINGNSNVIYSGSNDNTIRFWDIRSNKSELYMIKGDNEKDNGIKCIKFISLKKKKDYNDNCGNYLYYGSYNGPIHIW